MSLSNCKSIIFILDTSPLSDSNVTHIISHSVTCFIFLNSYIEI